MQSYGREALTFNDVSLETRYADFLPKDTQINSRFSRHISLNAPYVSAAMDTVTEASMAIAMAKLGGLGVIHKNLSVSKQAEQAAGQAAFNGIISKPVVS